MTDDQQQRLQHIAFDEWAWLYDDLTAHQIQSLK
jgi:hypothetical protein